MMLLHFTRVCLTVLFVSMLLSCSLTYRTSQSAAGTAEPAAAVKVSKTEAVAIAVEYLKKESIAGQYLVETPLVTESEDNNAKWLVVFKHIQWETHRPSRAIIMVDKTSGGTKWVPAE